ncbi:hypothetical protein ACFV0C_24910 [Streptomyces sp. NPDC059568]|uniref:hypothetical protein n=1 Tax=Streptomyces sp. NPDC059568 TaxID=3346868 RepID=UPI00367E2417
MSASPSTLTSLGLSCYTANLVRYLAVEWDAGEIFARSVRLAVRGDGPSGGLAFSHHAPALDLLPDGTRLRYAGAGSAVAALAELDRELAGYGRFLTVVDGSRLPWSPAAGAGPAPHWLLVDGRDGDRWHVVDDFTGLLPGGEQLPHTGWLDTDRLCRAMTLPPRWTPEQERRNSLAFGTPVPLPAVRTALWLRRTLDTEPAAVQPGQCWVTGDTQVLPFLADHFAEHGTAAAVHLDDLWAAAGHRTYAYRLRLARIGTGTGTDTGTGRSAERRALGTAIDRWENLPRQLRFAVESARRGRPRPALLRGVFEELLLAERDLV